MLEIVIFRGFIDEESMGFVFKEFVYFLVEIDINIKSYSFINVNLVVRILNK